MALTFDAVRIGEEAEALARLLEKEDTEGTFFLCREIFEKTPGTAGLLKKLDQEVGILYLNARDYQHKESWQPRSLKGCPVRFGEAFFKEKEISAATGPVVQWSVNGGTGSQEEILKKIQKEIYPGAILRLEADAGVLKAMPAILSFLEKQGYEVEGATSLIDD